MTVFSAVDLIPADSAQNPFLLKTDGRHVVDETDNKRDYEQCEVIRWLDN